MRRGDLVLFGSVAAATVLFALLPPFWAFLASSAFISALLISSVGVVYGRAGMVSLCQVTFAGIGGWVVGYLGVATAVPYPVALVLGALAAVPVGVVIGLPALRLRGVNLAVVTLGFAVAVSSVVFVQGFPGARTNDPVTRPGLVAGERGFMVFTAAVFLIVAAALLATKRTRLGAAWEAVRHSERATAALGLSVSLIKLSAFAVSAFVAGLAGGLLAAQLGFLNARNVEPVDSLVVFVIGVFVGAHHVGGALLGGVLGSFFPELLRRLSIPQDVGPILFAIGATHILARGGRGLAEHLGRRRPAAGGDVLVLRPEGGAPTRHRADPGRDLVLRASGIEVRYGAVVALEDVDVEVAQGRILGLIGPNGAGKSTLVDVITGFHRPDAGSVTVGETVLDGLPAHRRARLGIRRTFQTERTVPALGAGEYLRLAAGGHLDRAEVVELLAFLDGPDPDTPVYAVDTGTRRRLEIMGCLAARPTFLLLDEPAAGLTEDESLRLADRLRQVPERFGVGLLVVEHDIDLVAAVCDELVVLDFGRVIGRGAPDEVLASDVVAEAYLGV